MRKERFREPDDLILELQVKSYQRRSMVGDGITSADMAERDLLVVDMVRERGIPVGLVLSSGDSAESWKIHADAIEGMLTRFDRGLLITSHSAPVMMPAARIPIP